MSLMSRIKFVDPPGDFLSLDEATQLEQIRQLQLARIDALEASRKVKTGTRSAAKNKAKRGQDGSAQVNKLAKLLQQMSPEKAKEYLEAMGIN